MSNVNIVIGDRGENVWKLTKHFVWLFVCLFSLLFILYFLNFVYQNVVSLHVTILTKPCLLIIKCVCVLKTAARWLLVCSKLCRQRFHLNPPFETRSTSIFRAYCVVKVKGWLRHSESQDKMFRCLSLKHLQHREDERHLVYADKNIKLLCINKQQLKNHFPSDGKIHLDYTARHLSR